MHAVTQGIVAVEFSIGNLSPALNMVHPKVAQAFMKEFKTDALPFVPFGQWFSKLEGHVHHANEEDIANNPAIKLHESFRVASTPTVPVGSAVKLLVWEYFSADMLAVSPTMAFLDPITEQGAESWIKSWTARGLFHQ
ncbi:hypothetical protein PLICRDRAFT_91196 [Plicaturopsis crispa FD-325 SS-3]|nr:hypothetical protein PLICRDRAFT_91196 [Plicaturopsis crispa FD-325 SS-3]